MRRGIRYIKQLILSAEIIGEIKAAAFEEGADLVVLGQSAEEDNVFALEALQTCAAEIEAETGAQAVII